MKVTSYFIAVMFLINGSANAECLKYGDVVSIFFGANHKYLVAEKDGSANANRSSSAQWEAFLLVDNSGAASGNEVMYGDTIALLSYHDKYLVAEINGNVNANRNTIGDWEKWTIVEFNGSLNTNGCVFISTQAIVGLKSNHGKYLNPSANGEAIAQLASLDASPMPNNSTYLGIYKRDWTDFYYNRAIPSLNGSCNRCPFRGRFDSANCYVGKAPISDAFIYDGNFYYKGSTCILGQYDDANCMVGNNPGAAQPFLVGNRYYLKNNCISSSSSNCGSSITGMGNYWNKLTAKHRAKNDWRTIVTQTYGNDYSKWKKAIDKELTCESVGSFLNWSYNCTAKASPCSD